MAGHFPQQRSRSGPPLAPSHLEASPLEVSLPPSAGGQSFSSLQDLLHMLSPPEAMLPVAPQNNIKKILVKQDLQARFASLQSLVLTKVELLFFGFSIFRGSGISGCPSRPFLVFGVLDSQSVLV